MPPCHIRNVKLVAEADLPILPFLAPRVFKPWPFMRQPSRSYCDNVLRCSKSLSLERPPRGQCQVHSAATRTPSSHPLTLQTRGYAAREESISKRKRTPATQRRRESQGNRLEQTSRSKLAQEWYENALGGLDVQLPHQLVHQHAQDHEERNGGQSSSRSPIDSTRNASGKAQPKRARSPGLQTSEGNATSPLQKSKLRQWHKENALRRSQRLRAWVKGRSSAQRLHESFPVRSKVVHVGHPYRLQTKNDESSSLADLAGEKESLDQSEADSVPIPQHELAYTIPEPTYRWNLTFARLQIRHGHGTGPSQVRNQPLGLDSEAAVYARSILEQAPSGLDIAQLEDRFAISWYEIWLNAAIHLLDTSPREVPSFLTLTHVHPHPPSAWTRDCLQFLAERLSVQGARVSKDAFDELVRVFCTLMDRPGPSPMRLMGSSVRLLLHNCNKDQALILFDKIGRHGVQVHWNTLLHLSTFLARNDCFDKALDALLDSARCGADTHSSQFESTCATILRKAISQADGLRVSLRIIQNLSELGVKMNVQHCNIVILNAVESGDLQSAFSVYHSLIENGLQADKYTHAILLKGCKAVIEDSDTLNATIRQAIQDSEALKSPVVATEILHCLYLHHFQQNPETALATVAEAYTQLFDATSLIRMHILPADSQDGSETQHIRPTLAAQGIMVSAYLRHRTDRHTPHLARQQYKLYKHMRSLVERGIEPWFQLAKTDYVANAFLMAFTSHPSSLDYAAEVIRDMQTTLPADLDSPNPALQVERELCKPTVQSWSIFLNGFTKHKKIDLAVQVMEYMHGKGMKPNQVTWNSLLSGYTSTRDHDGAVRAFREMQEQGLKGNDVTLKAMSRVRVDAGMLSQGEEVRGALRARIEKGEVYDEADTETVNVRRNNAHDEQEEAKGEFWDSSQDAAEGSGAAHDETADIVSKTAKLAVWDDIYL